MADKKISELTNIIGADLSDDDEFVVVDTSAAETKAITYAELKKINGDLTVSGTVDGRDLSVDGAKLDGIESGATGDQAASEVPYTNTTSGLTATNVQDAVDEVEGRVDTLESVSHTHANKAVLDATTASFTTADETKLDGIETNADVTDTANVTAAGALMDSELTNINAVKALDQGVATTDSPSFVGVTATTADIDGGTIDGTTIGGTSAAAGTFTTATATTGNITTVNATTVDATNVEVTNIKAKDGTAAGSIADLTGIVTLASSVLTTTDINGGTIDGVTIGGSSAGAITGTTITGSSFVTTGDMTFGDNDKAIFGAGSDLQIYSDGTKSYLIESGTGDLEVRATDFVVKNAGNTKTMASFNDGGAVQLRYDNAVKLATTSTGVDVTGTVTADGLTVDGAGSVTGTLGVSDAINYNGASVFFIRSRLNGGTVQIGTETPAGTLYYPINIVGSSDYTSFHTSTGEAMRIVASGNVGIGTSSPFAKLHVQGSAPEFRLYSDTTTGGNINFIDQGWQSQIQGTGGQLLFKTGGTTERLRIDSSGNVGIGTSAPNNKAQVSYTSVAAVPSAGAGGHGFAVGDSGFGIAAGALTSGNGYLQATRWDGSATNYNLILQPNGGNVGIGTSLPQDPLHVAGDIRMDNAGYIVSESNTGVGVRMLGINAGNAAYVGPIDSGPTGVIFNASTTSVTSAFYTGGTERMRIDASGNVGIGTTSPQSDLEIQSKTTGTDAVISLTAAGTRRYQIKALTSVGALTFVDESLASERMRIDASGRVGIGTSTSGPSEKLHVYGSNDAKIWLQNYNVGRNAFNNDATNSGVLLTAGGMNSSTSRYTPAISFGSTDAELITENPKTLAGIVGVARQSYTNDTGSSMAMDFFTTTSGQTTHNALNRMRIEHNGDIAFWDDTGTSFGFYWDASESNLGIGTSNPSATLDVNGDALINGITVGLGSGSVVSNTALGQSALGSVTTGNSNTATGYLALTANTTGASNTALGREALEANTTGTNNTAVGLRALEANTTGDGNTAVGRTAGDVLTTGSRNTILGVNCDPSALDGNDQVVVGYALTGKGNDTAFIGGTNGAYNEKNVITWEMTSDERIKKNITDNNDGLSVLSQIQVRNFEYRTPEEITDLPSHAAIKQEGVQLGVIAQEIQQVLPECVSENSTGVLSVNTDPLVWYLINAVKELKAEIETLKGN